MSDKDRDQIIWDTIFNFYKETKIKKNGEWTFKKMEDARKMNQEESYWCRKDGKNQKLFINKPEQRLMARFVKSFLNTSHKGGLRETIDGEKWFDKQDIICFLQGVLQGKIKNAYSTNDTNLKDFVTDACSLLTTKLQTGETIKLTKYNLKKEQTANLNALREIVDLKYKTKKTSYEGMIVAQIEEEPYITILKMKKLIRGFGIALTCDFLKESHLCNIAKPDVHLRHVFSMIDRIPYSEDLILVKRISEFAKNVGKNSNPDDFCNSGPYYIDKIIWMLCSRNKYYKDKNGKEIPIPDFKNELLKRIAAKVKEIDRQN